MKLKMILVLSLIALLLPAVAAAETWSKVPVVDTMCSAKAKDNPDAHTKACALQCSQSGFGMITADGDFVKFDQAGNEKFLELLKKSPNADHVRATVSGTRSQDTVQVSSIALE